MNRSNLFRQTALLVGSLVLLTSCAVPTPTATPVPPTAPRVPPTATSASTAAAGVTLTWFGQSMFTMKVANGPTIMMDPVAASVGYKVAPIVGVDVVTVTHEHSDHNNVALAQGSPKILRGLAGIDWAKVDETFQGVRIRTVNLYHDDTQGSARGKDAAFVFEASGFKIVHVGDLGHLLSPEQIAAIGPVDVLMIPVGGNYTIDAAKATQVAGSLKPRVVIPMHYKTAATSLPIEPVDAFLNGKTVERAASNKLTISAQTLPKSTTVYVLGYE
jgi:L-ascorbate metabolism protein UlaG (beta-lactamase superfamily)